jgi:hypothetical protein
MSLVAQLATFAEFGALKLPGSPARPRFGEHADGDESTSLARFVPSVCTSPGTTCTPAHVCARGS